MALLFNAKTQALEDVPDEQAGAALRSGSHGLTEGKIQVQSPSGDIVAIPTAEAAQAYELGFTTPARAAISKAEDTAQSEQYKEHFDDPALAAEAGFLRGSTLGTSDLITTAAGKAMGVDLQNASKTLKEENPIASTAGEVGGAVAGSLATGGFGTQGFLKGAAEAGEAAKALGIADSTSNLLKIGQIGSSALQGAAEGAVQGAGIGLSDALLNKSDDVAEKVIMNALSGAKFGGFIGAGGGALSEYGMPAAEAVLGKGKELAEIASANAGKLIGKISSKFVKDPEAAASFQEAMSRPDILRMAEHVPAKTFEKEAARVAKEVEAEFTPLKTYGKELGEDLKTMANSSKEEFVNEVRTASGDAEAAMASIKAKKDALYDTSRDLASGLADQPASGHLADAIDQAMHTVRKFEASGQTAERDIAKKLQERLSYVVPDSKILALKGQDLKAALNSSLNGETELQGTKLLEEFTGDLLKSYNTGLRTGQSKLVGQNYKALNELDKTASSIYEKIPNTDVGQAFIDARKYNAVYQDINRALFKKGELKSQLSSPAYFDSLNTLLDQVADVAPQLKNLATMAGGVKRTNELKSMYQSLSKEGRLDPAVLEPFVKEMGGDLGKLKDVKVLADLQKEFQASPNMTPQDKLLRLKSVLGQDSKAMLDDMAATQQRMGVLGKVAGGSSGKSGWNATDWIASRFLSAPVMAAYKSFTTLRNDPYLALQAASKLVNTYDKMSQVVARAGTAVADLAKSRVPIQIAVSAHRTTSSEDLKKAKDTITLLNDPKTFQEVMGQKTAALSSQPTVSLAINNQTAKMAQFLQSKLPVTPEGSFAGPTPQPSSYETAKFSRYLNAVEDPIGAVHRIAAGRGTPEEIETLKTVYPKTFSDLQKSIMDGIVSSGAELPYSKRIALSQMFDLSLDSTLNGDFVQAMQANLHTTPNGGAGRPQGSTDKAPRFKRNFDQAVATDLQKMTNGEYK